MTNVEFRRTRRLLDLTQQELAAKLGIGNRQISQYERGKATIPPYVQLAMRQIEQEMGARNA